MVDTYALLGRVAGSIGPPLELDSVLEMALVAMRKLVAFRGGTTQLIDDHGVPPAADGGSTTGAVVRIAFQG